ncbi:MAG: carboxypeptidase-like regulatory domain-containing protein [Thermoanaerobaculaceae bacterium]|jgi:hypothetical protein
MTRRGVENAVRLLVLTGLFGVAAACKPPVRIPEIHGRVVDARTGAPIAGAIVKRRLYRPGSLNLVDGSRPFPVEGGDASTRSKADGRFILPPFSAPAFTGMAWLVYAPGWMPAYYCYSEADWPFGGCSGFGLPGIYPWTSATVQKGPDRIDLDVRVFPPTLDGVTFRSYNTYTKQWVTFTPTPEYSDPWAHYFSSLNSLCREQWLPVEVYLKVAVGYLEGRKVTEGILVPLAELTDSINPHLRPDLVSERCGILHAIVGYCEGSNDTQKCTWPTVRLCVRDYQNDCEKPENLR